MYKVLRIVVGLVVDVHIEVHVNDGSYYDS